MEPERTRVAAWRGIGAGLHQVRDRVDASTSWRTQRRWIRSPTACRSPTTARARRVLEKVARDVGLGQEARRPARALGIAFAEYGAVRAEVRLAQSPRSPRSRSTAKTGAIRVHNYWAAADAGLALNPDAFAAQVESGIVWGLSVLRSRSASRW